MVTACFKERSTVIRCLFFLVTVLIMILVAIAIIIVNRNEVDNHTCKLDQCIALSTQLNRYIDRSMSPCEDFHSFVCGNFMKNRREQTPPDPEIEIEHMIKDMPQMNDSKPFIMLKSFYLACSNLGGIEMDDDETLLNLFYGLGEWPVLRGQHWDGTRFDWTEVAIKSRRAGLKFDWFLEFSVYEDVNDTGLNILKIDIPPISRLKNNESEALPHLFTTAAISLGAPERLAHYETGRTIDFEKELGELAEKYRSKKRHLNAISLPKTTINELQLVWPSIQWLHLINNITGLRLIGTDTIIFDEVYEYLKDLNKLIFGTPKRIVADYMMWKIVEDLWPYLSQPVREKFEEFNEQQYDRQPERDRQKFCINESRKQFPLIVESEYIRRHVTQHKKQSIKEMLFIMKNKFIQLVRRATWINKEERAKALFKLEKLEFLVGGPRQVFDEFGFAEDLGLYDFAFKSRNVIDMLTERRLRYYDHYFRRINKFVKRNTEKFYKESVNITRFSLINNNTLVIPASILRNDIYNPSLPNYFNYASVGKLVAHEIFEHIFERKNRTIINEENRNYNSIWTSDVFDQAVKCLIRDSPSLHPEFRRPKKMRQFLADIVAPEVAYESYKDWSLTHLQEFKLPALEFTPSQLFWIQASKLSCSKIYSKYDRDYSRFKVIGPVRNSQNFANDFNCTADSRMVSSSMCRIL